MPNRKSDAHKGDVTAVAAGADDTSQTNAVDNSVLSTTTTPADHEKSINEGLPSTKKGKEAAAAAENDKITIEDLTLPKSIITRLAKGVLPANTQIQANAIMAMSKSTTVFISYLAAHANEITLNANKKTIMPADVFKALEEIEFDFLKEPLEAEFAKFNAIQTDKRNTYRQKVKAATKPTGGNDDEDDDTDMAGGDTSTAAAATTASKATAPNGDGDEAPRSKKARVDTSPAAEETTEAEEDAIEETDDEEEDEKDEEDDEEEEEVGEEEDEEEEEEEEEEDDDGEGRISGEETQDTLEERTQREELDEALDGDESD